MTTQSLLLLAAFLVVLLALSYPLGVYLARVGEDKPIRGLGWLTNIEHMLYRLAGVAPGAGMGWKSYAIALLVASG